MRTVRRECLDQLIPLNERHLRAILTEFVHYYNHDRPHRTLGLQPPAPRPQSHYGAVTVRPVLGGLHHVYQRAASTGPTFAALQALAAIERLAVAHRAFFKPLENQTAEVVGYLQKLIEANEIHVG